MGILSDPNTLTSFLKLFPNLNACFLGTKFVCFIMDHSCFLGLLRRSRCLKYRYHKILLLSIAILLLYGFLPFTITNSAGISSLCPLRYWLIEARSSLL